MSLDIAPFREQPTAYAVSVGQDPLLSYRAALIRRLRSLENVDFGVPIAFVIESDHVHLQMSAPSRKLSVRNLIVPWRVPRPHLYPQSALLHSILRSVDKTKKGVPASVIREVRKRVALMNKANPL